MLGPVGFLKCREMCGGDERLNFGSPLSADFEAVENIRHVRSLHSIRELILRPRNGTPGIKMMCSHPVPISGVRKSNTTYLDIAAHTETCT